MREDSPIDVDVSQSGPVATVTIRRPPDNYFDAALIGAIADAYESLATERSCRAIVLRSEGQGKDEEGVYYPGAALWKGRAAQLDEGRHYSTIVNGRRFAFMPQWGDAPAPGVPAPPNPLTEEQIKAVMRYERSL